MSNLEDMAVLYTNIGNHENDDGKDDDSIEKSENLKEGK